MQKPTFLGLSFGLMMAAGSAMAQYPSPPPPPGYGYAPRPVQTFGGPGTLALSSDMNFRLEGCSNCANAGTVGGGAGNIAGNSSGWNIRLAPSADYFVIQGLSIGGQIVLAHTHSSTSASGGDSTSSSTDTTTFGVGARVGYNIPITDLISFWPKVGLVYSETSASGNSSGNVFDLQIYAPFLLHLAPHFFAGLGPNLQTDLTASESENGVSVPNVPKATSYGILFTIGGWTVPAG